MQEHFVHVDTWAACSSLPSALWQQGGQCYLASIVHLQAFQVLLHHLPYPERMHRRLLKVHSFLPLLPHQKRNFSPKKACYDCSTGSGHFGWY